jgi:hypothetical protein
MLSFLFLARRLNTAILPHYCDPHCIVFAITIFTTKANEERIRLEREDRKAKLETRALRRAEAGSSIPKEREKSESVDKLGEMLLKKLAVQENTFKELSGKANSNNERANHTDGEADLEKMKRETVEALMILRLYL